MSRGRGRFIISGTLFALCAAPASAVAETGYDAWLRHAPLGDAGRRRRSDDGLPAGVVVLGDSAGDSAGDSTVLGAARDELIRGVRGALGRTLRVLPGLPDRASLRSPIPSPVLGGEGPRVGSRKAFPLPNPSTGEGAGFH